MELALKVADIAVRGLMDKDVSDDDKQFLREYEVRYALVKFLYKEKYNQLYPDQKLINFSFTPGDGFMETPIVDLVESLLEIKRKTDSGQYKPIPLSNL